MKYNGNNGVNKIKIRMCPNCGAIVVNSETCPVCGIKLPEDLPEVKYEDYKIVIDEILSGLKERGMGKLKRVEVKNEKENSDDKSLKFKIAEIIANKYNLWNNIAQTYLKEGREEDFRKVFKIAKKRENR